MSLSKTVSGWADEIRKMQGGGSSKEKALGKAKMAETNPRKAGASMQKNKVRHFEAIKEHVSGGKKSKGFNDPFWYSKK